MSFNELLIHTIDIESVTKDYSGGDGASSQTWAASSSSYEDVKCRRVDIRGTFEENIGGRNEKSTHKFIMKGSQDISVGNRINEDSTYYIVTFIGTGSTRTLHHKTAYARLIQ